MIEEELLTIAKGEFEQILLFVKESNNTQISDMEKGIFQRLLKLGCILLLMFVQKIVKKGDNYHIDKSGTPRAFHSIKRQNYFSVFGKIEIARPYYWEKGLRGICPVDAELNLPEEGRSYLLQEWGTCLAVEQPYNKAASFLNKFLGIQLWDSSLEEMTRKSSAHVNDFYKERQFSDAAKNAILVATIDCKGIQMRKSELIQKSAVSKKAPLQFRRMRRVGEKMETSKKQVEETKSEEKDGKKKMSVVTAVYTIDSHVRTVKEIITKHKKETKKTTTPRPQQKIVFGTLNGKQRAFEQLKLEVGKYDLKNKKLVALVDGEIKLNEMLAENFPGFEIIRDFIHVTEYLWDGAHIFHGEGSKEAQELASKYIEMVLNGQVGKVICEIKQTGQKINRSKSKKKELHRVIQYLENGKTSMKYDEYIGKGYPIASGVIEGTCRNLVNDRFEHAGMHWSKKGANGLLGMRAIELSGLTEEYWRLHRNKERERLYGHVTEVLGAGIAA